MIELKQVGDDYLVLFGSCGGERLTGACIGAGKTKSDALAEAVRTLSDAMGEVCRIAPVPEVEGLYPLVLYFGTQADADECSEMIQACKPNLQARKL